MGTAPRSRLAFLAFAALLVAGCSAPGPSNASARINVTELTVEQIQQAYARGDYTAVQLTQAFLDRIAEYEDHYNAFISMNPDALAIAASLDEEMATRGSRGPLHGVPIVIKDNIDYGGLVTTAGYSGFSTATGGLDMVPDDDAAVAERLRAAGAIILGKTNMPDFAADGTRTKSTVAGVTLNAYDITKAPGGSSGGTATAVNASFAVLGLGTETGGSIQNPAAAQGLVGVKPTFGLVPLEGVVPMSAHIDVVGPLAKTVYDAAVTLDILAGPTHEGATTNASQGHLPQDGYAAGLSTTSLQGKRFGLVGTGWRTSNLPLAPETEVLYREAIAALEAEGASVVEDPLQDSGFVELYRNRARSPSSSSDAMQDYLRGLGEGAAFNSREEYEEVTGKPFRGRSRGGARRGGANTRGRRSAGRAGESQARSRRGGRRAGGTENRGGERRRGAGRQDASERRSDFGAWRLEIQALFRGVLDEHDLDGLFFPQASAPIKNLIEDPDRPNYSPNNHPELPSNICNDIGLPVVTVPFAYYDDGTPFVLALIGDMWTEADLLAYAYDFEQATSARVAPTIVTAPKR